jgi:hypothetical protein
MLSKTEWAAANGITIEHERATANPSMPDDEWQRSARHYKVTLRRAGKKMTVFFSKGSGHEGRAPAVGEVLESLALDAASIDSTSGFEDWAREFGFEVDDPSDPAYKRAKRSYAATQREKAKLETFLGDLYEDLLTNTEAE